MTEEEPKPKVKRIIRRRRRKQAADDEPSVDPILLQKVLQESSLPDAYSFEIPKTVQRIQQLQAQHVSLQMPEGLLLYAAVVADILQRLCPTLEQVSILGDVTYGACCIDDLGAQALGAQLLVHYGHSCLVPLQHTVVPCLYVFVEIQIDVPHMVACLQETLSNQKHELSSPAPIIYLLGTVQFRHALVTAKKLLLQSEHDYPDVQIPQVKPLSPGEVLGCTSPTLPPTSDPQNPAIVCFVADGRFHLESTLISNPHMAAFYRYDPYSKTLTHETYHHEQMKDLRQSAIRQAAAAGTQTFGILMGTLGRQGNPAIVQRVRQALKRAQKRSFLMLVSEITPAKLALLDHKVDAWVQIACPRLSVDWGHALSSKPVLSPYELFCCLEETEWRDVYPMDYYSQAGGPWTNYYQDNQKRQLEAL